ncbi:hypothetical protein D2V08_03570 [Flagellimonas lutimaris]|uniref:Fibronectin type-III domain-containing protein n=1 Tax=Flagellimonas lutimaris TaxID=475082 RepID=A0A3A1NFG5_9FLAO|nr:hypothetical protein [Allomuricauda lutimaris]RIV35712.1 hypothetical protein D2V08_03570 [Allomuricauda lutimaris]
MKKVRLISRVLYVVIIPLFLSCGGGGGGEQPLPEPEPSNDLPARVLGALPANGEPCSDYEEVPSDESKVLIAFNWNAAQYADSYELVVLEDNSEVFRDTFSNLETQVELQRGKTYTWSVNSINEFGETSGNTYSFTTPGTPVGNYAPYAAEISIDFNTGTMEMSIGWIGNDEDNDVLIYDVKVWENENVLMEEANYTLDSLEPVLFLNGESYSVEVVSKDTSGNFSISTMSAEAP